MRRLRANQTPRLTDVKYHRVTSPEQETTETPWQSAEWVNQLKLCAADEPFFKRHRTAPTGHRIAEFLLQDRTFPRSVRHCFERAAELVHAVQAAAERKRPTAPLEATLAMLERLRSANISSVIASGLHAELTRVVDAVALICHQLHEDFFDPPAELDVRPTESLTPPPPGSRAQSQSQAQGGVSARVELSRTCFSARRSRACSPP